ncbi:MAG: ion transporter [Actinobacteria bacterium]|nr:ion transporter [Actinomycetota bacterium]
MTTDGAGRDAGATFDPDPDEEPTRRDRLAGIVERRLDPFMAVLAVVWALFLGYELVAPSDQRTVLATISNVIWVIFVVEFLVKLAIAGHPLRFLRRRWPSVLFLVLPALRVLRLFQSLRVVRILPAARVLGSSYRAIGTASTLLQGRIGLLAAMTGIAIVSGGQLVFVLERGHLEDLASLGDALWWAANVATTGTLVFEPVTLPGRLLSIVLSAFAMVVFAALAAALGAFFVESRAERAAAEE